MEKEDEVDIDTWDMDTHWSPAFILVDSIEVRWTLMLSILTLLRIGVCWGHS